MRIACGPLTNQHLECVMATSDLTAGELRQLLIYDSVSGEFTWRNARGRKTRAGAKAGYTSNGYIRIGINGKDYFAHCLVWLYAHGSWPTADIDHIDGIRSNNCLLNLRQAKRAENLQNQRAPRSDNKSGFLGVSFDAKRGMYKAALKVSGKTVFTKRTITAEEAASAYLEAKRKHHPFSVI